MGLEARPKGSKVMSEIPPHCASIGVSPSVQLVVAPVVKLSTSLASAAQKCRIPNRLVVF
jgi:hypothetical protein